MTIYVPKMEYFGAEWPFQKIVRISSVCKGKSAICWRLFLSYRRDPREEKIRPIKQIDQVKGYSLQLKCH